MSDPSTPREIRWLAWNRRWHTWMGLFLLLFLWLFAVSGLILNHPNWKFAQFWQARQESTAPAGVKLPVVPVKRQIFTLDTAVKPEGPLPLTILLSGLYFRTETGGMILLGKSMDEDPVGYSFGWDDQRFMELLWPELAEFVPAWERLKLVRGWAGLYDVNTLDHNAIIGEWPEIRGLYLATGFSGHGLQQGPAVGRYLSELILKRPPALPKS